MWFLSVSSLRVSPQCPIFARMSACSQVYRQSLHLKTVALPRQRCRPRLARRLMACCEAFDPIEESPPWRPDPHASSRRAHARTRTAPGRPALSAPTISPRAHSNPARRQRIAFFARTNSILARPNPSASRQRPKCTNEPPPHIRIQTPAVCARSNPFPARPNPRPPRTSPPPSPSPLRPPSAAPATKTPRCPSALATLGLPSWRDPCSTVRQFA